jgi:hypothetical protein
VCGVLWLKFCVDGAADICSILLWNLELMWHGNDNDYQTMILVMHETCDVWLCFSWFLLCSPEPLVCGKPKMALLYEL